MKKFDPQDDRERVNFCCFLQMQNALFTSLYQTNYLSVSNKCSPDNWCALVNIVVCTVVASQSVTLPHYYGLHPQLLAS